MIVRARKIYKAFGGKLVGSQKMKNHVCLVLSKMPDQIVKFVTKKVWFMGSMEDAWGFTFTGKDLDGQHLIFLSDELFRQSESQINYSIAHEVGHVVLGHKNSTLYKQTKREIGRQEKEANAFAKKYTK